MTEAEMLQRIEDLETKSGQAYQVIGDLLWRCGLHETKEGTGALDCIGAGIRTSIRSSFNNCGNGFPVDDRKLP